MQLPALREESGVGHRADWMPDPGTYDYVKAMLSEIFRVDVENLPEHWIPLGITGTLNWVTVTGWWVFIETGLYDTNLQRDWVFRYQKADLDPRALQVFQNDPERNTFEQRSKHPGLTADERQDALQYLMQDVYENMLANWHDDRLTPREREELVPPIDFGELVLYCSLMWILSDYGEAWIRTLDPMLEYIYESGVAYLCQFVDKHGNLEEDPDLLPPPEVSREERVPGCCIHCGHRLTCVAGFSIDDGFYEACHQCMRWMAEDETEKQRLDLQDGRLSRPRCPHYGGDCPSLSCPYNEAKEDPRISAMKKRGRERMQTYRRKVAEQAGPARIAGHSVDDIVKHFRP